MPIDPDIRLCQFPRCRAQAMAGHNNYHSHHNHQFGPCAARSSKGDSCPLLSGHDAHPSSSDELRRLAFRITQEPDHLPQLMNTIVHAIHGRDHSPVSALLLLDHVLQGLIPLLSDSLFACSLDASSQEIPPS